MRMYRVEDKYCCTGQEMYQMQRRLETVLRADCNENSARVIVWPVCTSTI